MRCALLSCHEPADRIRVRSRVRERKATSRSVMARPGTVVSLPPGVVVPNVAATFEMSDDGGIVPDRVARPREPIRGYRCSRVVETFLHATGGEGNIAVSNQCRSDDGLFRHPPLSVDMIWSVGLRDLVRSRDRCTRSLHHARRPTAAVRWPVQMGMKFGRRFCLVRAMVSRQPRGRRSERRALTPSYPTAGIVTALAGSLGSDRSLSGSIPVSVCVDVPRQALVVGREVRHHAFALPRGCLFFENARHASQLAQVGRQMVGSHDRVLSWGFGFFHGRPPERPASGCGGRETPMDLPNKSNSIGGWRRHRMMGPISSDR
jgi:hypothetical protein